MEERRLLRLLEAALSVSEYTGLCRFVWAKEEAEEASVSTALRTHLAARVLLPAQPALPVQAPPARCCLHARRQGGCAELAQEERAGARPDS